MATVLLSAFVMASRPWGCSVSSDPPVITCDWATSRSVAGVWLIVGLGVCFIALKRWKLALAIISVPLLALSLISFLGVYSLAPAALWSGCALWLWVRGRAVGMVVGAFVSIVLVYLVAQAVVVLFALRSAPF